MNQSGAQTDPPPSDRESLVGRLDKALTEARERGWTVVDMVRDWWVVYPWEAAY